MTTTLESVSRDETAADEVVKQYKELAGEEIVGIICTGKSEDLFFTPNRVIVAKKGSIAKFFGWGLVGAFADALYKGWETKKLSDLSPDKILRANKNNFIIPHEEITKFEIRKTFPFGTWEIRIDTKTARHVFFWDLGIGRDLRKHVRFLMPLLSERVSILD